MQFEPPLPASFMDAIGKHGMGLLEKFVLVFDRVYWTQDATVFLHVDGATEDACMVGQCPTGRDAGGSNAAPAIGESRMLYWINGMALYGKPFLIAFGATAYAAADDARADADLQRELMGIVRRMDFWGSRGPRAGGRRLQGQIAPNMSIPDPVRFVASRWLHDPFALGSYSYLAPGALPWRTFRQMQGPFGAPRGTGCSLPGNTLPGGTTPPQQGRTGRERGRRMTRAWLLRVGWWSI